MSTSPEEIRREIRQTQARLGEKVEALASQKANAKEEMKGAIVEKASEAKDVVMGKIAKKKEEVSSKAAEKKSEVMEMAGKAKDKVAESAKAAKEKVMDGSGSAEREETLTMEGNGATLKEKARGVASSTLAKLPDKEDLRRGADKAGAAITDNPAVFALGSLAAGLLVGLAAPLTRTERQKVGPLASQARVKAIATGTRAAAEQVSQKVDRGVDAVTQRVSEKIDTLTDQLKSTADKVGFGDVVQNVGERAKEGMATLVDEVAGRAKGKAEEVAERGKEKEIAAKEEQERSAETEGAAGSDPVPAESPPAGRYLGTR